MYYKLYGVLNYYFKVVYTQKYGDVHEKFHFWKKYKIKALEHLLKHFETILLNLPLGKCEI